MAQTIRYLALAGFFGCGIWIGSDKQQVEPYVAAIVAGAAFIALDVKFLSDRTRRNSDRKLFKQFLTTIPSHGSISFLEKHDFAGSFHTERLAQTDAFLHEWNDPEHEFLDPELEKLREELHDYIKEFNKAIAQNTFPVAAGTKQSVPPEWERDRPEQYKQAVAELHDLADEIVKMHRNLVRTARWKLGADEVD